MASYTTVPTKGQGEPFLESMWDASIRDNLNGMLNPPLAVVSRSTTLSLTPSVPQAVDMTTETYDSDSTHSTVTNASRLTCVSAGVYLVSSVVTFSVGTGTYQAQLRKNSAVILATQWAEEAASATYATVLNVGTLVAMDPGEWVEVFAMASGSGQSVASAELQWCWVGRAA